jgi:hypothetical protein
MPPKRTLKKPNVAPKLSSMNERVRLDRLRTMSSSDHFTTSVIGEIARYDELRRYGSIGAILTGVYYKNITSDNRNTAVRMVEDDFGFFRRRALIDRGSLVTLQQEIGRVHLTRSDFLEQISATHLGAAIIVRDMDLEEVLLGTAKFNPVADGLLRGSSYKHPDVNADPYTTSKTRPGDPIRSHVAEIIAGLSVSQISERIGIATEVQDNRHTHWKNALDAYQESRIRAE